MDGRLQFFFIAVNFSNTPGKIHQINTLRGCSFIFFHLAVNKLKTEKMQNIFSLVAEFSGFKNIHETK